MKKKGGFTLIELLVVISIIGLISSVVLSAVNSARLKAQDVRRVIDMREIEKALQMYYHDNGTYPASADTCNDKDWPLAFKTALAPYMSSIPIDPSNDLAVCGPTEWNYYYQFANPVGNWLLWNGTACDDAITPTPIVLWSVGRPDSKFYINECEWVMNVNSNTIILNRR